MAVFLSHAHHDGNSVVVLREELDRLVDQVWFDRGLTGGQVWWDEILSQLRRCKLFVLALSDSSVQSQACMAELDYVISLGRPWLAVRVDDTELVRAPEAIRRTQVIDFVSRDADSVRALAKAVLRAPAPGPLPELLSEPPPMPLSYRDRFAEIFAATLSMDQQVSLFARLKFDIENGNNEQEAFALLRSLCERDDLSWKLHQDISTVLSLETVASDARVVQDPDEPDASEDVDHSVGEPVGPPVVPDAGDAQGTVETGREVDWSVPLPPALASGEAPDQLGVFVGRAAELEQLSTRMEKLRPGRAEVVMVSGEAGIGKTELCTRFAQAAADEDAIVLYGRSDEDLGIPYQPWVEVLSHLVMHAPRHLVARNGGVELARLVPAVRHVLPDLAAPTGSDPETERYLLFGAVAELLTGASEHAPVLVVLDDLHWADKPTLMLLRHLVNVDHRGASAHSGDLPRHRRRSR